MSTLPGRDAWRDAGLTEPDRRRREAPEADPDDMPLGELEDLVEQAVGGLAEPDAGEDYRPGPPRPDLDGAADEADVSDQADEVRLDDVYDDEYDGDATYPDGDDFDDDYGGDVEATATNPASNGG